MSKIYCVIDACSYIYLNRFTYTLNGKDTSLYELLKKADSMTLKHSRTIADEIKRNKTVDPKEVMEIDNNVYQFTSKKLDQYDKSIFNNSIASNVDDRGEKENLAVAIDLFLNKKFSVIYLSDDKKAIGENGHLRELMKAFPYYQIWSSFEVVLFLYFFYNRRSFDYNRAVDSIKDLVSFIFSAKRADLVSKRDGKEITNDEFSVKIQKLGDDAQKYQVKYTNRIDLIRNLIAA